MFGKSSRPSMANEKGAPGPGAYTAKYQSTLPEFSIPRSSSTWLKGSLNPGPGAYESRVINSNNSTIKMGKDARRPFYDEKKGIPGVGSYQSSLMEKTIGAK